MAKAKEEMRECCINPDFIVAQFLGYFFVFCRNCKKTGKSENTRKEAIKAWNGAKR